MPRESKTARGPGRPPGDGLGPTRRVTIRIPETVLTRYEALVYPSGVCRGKLLVEGLTAGAPAVERRHR